MGPVDDGRCALLLALRLAGVADVGALAARTGATPEAVQAALDAAGAEQLVRAGRAGQWALAPPGRRAGEELLGAVVAAAGAEPAVASAYERFLALNPRLLALCTDWQLRRVAGELVPNDHADPEHDAAVLDALGALHGEAAGVLEALAGVPTFESYGDRLANALARVRAGAVDYVLKPTVDSYHQVWFELHEHLLAALGLDRSSEAQRIAAEENGEQES